MQIQTKEQANIELERCSYPILRKVLLLLLNINTSEKEIEKNESLYLSEMLKKLNTTNDEKILDTVLRVLSENA